jgi:hypothetical protein
MRNEGSLLLASNQFPEGCSKNLWEQVISIMALYEITAMVKKDKTILMVGSDILRNKGAEKAGEILQQMWVLARIVLEGRKMTGGGGGGETQV